MIDHNYRDSLMKAECDTCGKKAEFNGDLKFCIAEAKENGWFFIKKKGVFYQYCSSECKREIKMLKKLFGNKTPKASLSVRKTVTLPLTFSAKQIEFIEEWYLEDGMRQLIAARYKQCTILDKKPPIKGVVYVDVEEIPVLKNVRDKNTLMAVQVKELKTVTLLLLNEWIK